MEFVKVVNTYKETFAFLSKSYWQNQDEYNEGMDEWFGYIRNHETIFKACPAGNLTLYDEEWTSPKSVDDTIDELDEDEDKETMFVSNWKDDDGNMFYTLMTKDPEDEDVRCVTRSLPMRSLDQAPDKLIENEWRPIKLQNGSQKLYIWESPSLFAYDFVEVYKSWVAQYSSGDDDTTNTASSNEDESDNSDISVVLTGTTASDIDTPTVLGTLGPHF